MGIYVVSASERSLATFNAPAGDSIVAALRAVQVPRARWVGPQPRITRRFDLPYAVTFVTWLLDVDEVTFAPGLRANIAQQVAEQLRHTTPIYSETAGGAGNGWSPVDVSPYAEAVNGPLAWWRSGEASRTHTALAFPSSTVTAALAGTNENPVGPTSPDTSPGTPTSDLARINKQLRDSLGLPSLGWIAGIAAVGLGLYYFGPALGNLASRATERRASARRASR
jgi:hypothetical protein